MKSSYDEKDVVILLKDISSLVTPLPAYEREILIQSGKHYSCMLPIEYVPSQKYMEIYEKTLAASSKSVAAAVAILAEKLIKKYNEQLTLVSLARAGTPIGILLKRYIEHKYKIVCPHYTISIIRDKGIDKNAMKYILNRHPAKALAFIDGWVGKGAILKELKSAISEFTEVSDEIAVLSDPAYVTKLCGTHEDILIPSACLNSTVCGLLSRTYLDDSVIGKHDFHGAIYYKDLAESDKSISFIESIEKYFDEVAVNKNLLNANEDVYDVIENEQGNLGFRETAKIAEDFKIKDINMVKPGIGETTRVLLRRVPYKILINKNCENDPKLAHIFQLAKEKNVNVETYPLKHYKCCGLVKKLTDI